MCKDLGFSLTGCFSAFKIDSAFIKFSIPVRVGGVDKQWTFPFETPRVFMAEVKRDFDAIAPDGGFICATIKNIQASVSPAILVAPSDTRLRYSRATV